MRWFFLSLYINYKVWTKDSQHQLLTVNHSATFRNLISLKISYPWKKRKEQKIRKPLLPGIFLKNKRKGIFGVWKKISGTEATYWITSNSWMSPNKREEFLKSTFRWVNISRQEMPVNVGAITKKCSYTIRIFLLSSVVSTICWKLPNLHNLQVKAHKATGQKKKWDKLSRCKGSKIYGMCCWFRHHLNPYCDNIL